MLAIILGIVAIGVAVGLPMARPDTKKAPVPTKK
jgi:hypothetical protein